MNFSFDENLRKSVKRMHLMAKRMAEEALIGNYRSRFKGVGLNFSELRQYVSGDDIRHIHWKATARSGKTFIKTYEEERQLSVFLIVDESASMLCNNSKSSYQKAINLAALIAFIAQGQNDHLGLLKFSSKPFNFIAPSNRRNSYAQLLSTLVSVNSDASVSDLPSALDTCLTRLKKRNLIFVISDFFTQAIESQVKLIAAKHDLILAFVKPVLPPEGLGLLKMYASESGEEFIFDSSNKRSRLAIENNLTAHSAKIKELAIRSGADFLEIVDDPIAPLRNFMTLRSKKK